MWLQSAWCADVKKGSSHRVFCSFSVSRLPVFTMTPQRGRLEGGNVHLDTIASSSLRVNHNAYFFHNIISSCERKQQMQNPPAAFDHLSLLHLSPGLLQHLREPPQHFQWPHLPTSMVNLCVCVGGVYDGASSCHLPVAAIRPHLGR